MLGQHNFDIHAGDFGTGVGYFSEISESFSLPKQTLAGCLLSNVEVATEENIKKLGGTVGWGIVGGALLGPVGLLAGLLMGGRGKKVVFIVQFRTGQKMLVSADSKAYIAIQAAAMDAPAKYARMSRSSEATSSEGARQPRWCPNCKAFNPGDNQLCVKCGAAMKPQSKGCALLLTITLVMLLFVLMEHFC